MIRFFGIILGFVLMVNIAVTAYNSGYSFSSITTLGREVIRKVEDTIRNIDTEFLVVQTETETALDTETNVEILLETEVDVAEEATITDTVDVAEETVSEIVEQVIEQPPEVRIFWGPFRTKGAANGFANMAESIGGLPTEIIEKGTGHLYVAFVGETEAIDLALTTFANETGMTLKETYVL